MTAIASQVGFALSAETQRRPARISHSSTPLGSGQNDQNLRLARV